MFTGKVKLIELLVMSRKLRSEVNLADKKLFRYFKPLVECWNTFNVFITDYPTTGFEMFSFRSPSCVL